MPRPARPINAMEVYTMTNELDELLNNLKPIDEQTQQCKTDF
jgi:hypothetical protein